VLEITPNVAFVMMDRMLGGPGQVLGPPRDLTEIERAVMDRIGLRAMDDLRQAWQQVGAFTPRILNLETNPLLIQVTSQNEVLLVANLRVKVGDTLGAVTLAYPYLLLEPVLDRLGLRRWAQIAATAPSPDSRAFVVRELSRSPLTLRAFLGRTTLSVRDLLGLTPGQLLRLEPSGLAPVRLHLNDVPKFTGRLGTRRTHLAVEVTGRLDEETPRL
jgi:flagellar motor switch protein FliM